MITVPFNKLAQYCLDHAHDDKIPGIWVTEQTHERIQKQFINAGFKWADGKTNVRPGAEYTLVPYAKEKILRFSREKSRATIELSGIARRNRIEPPIDDHYGFVRVQLSPPRDIRRGSESNGLILAQMSNYDGMSSVRIIDKQLIESDSFSSSLFRMDPFIPRKTGYYHKDHLKLTYVSDLSNDIYLYIDEHARKVIVNRGGMTTTGYKVYSLPKLVLYMYYSYFKKYRRANSMTARNIPSEWVPILMAWDLMYFENTVSTMAYYCEKRTKDRINDGVYFAVPTSFPKEYGTGVHLSTIDDKLLAYYPTNKHIVNDIPQRIKPGRYLKKYFPHLSDDEIRVLSAKVLAGVHLEIFTKGEDMVEQYMALANSDVVTSCMSKEKWDTHPLMVYDESDVQLAVMVMQDEPKARALFNKNTKEYPMIYGQWEKMKVLLGKNGFTHGSLDGAKIKRIPKGNNGGILMPYIDGHRKLDRSENNSTKVDVFEDHCVINRYGGYSANEYDTATIYPDGRSYDNDDDDDEDNYFSCHCCGEHTHNDEGRFLEYHDEYVCEYCFDNETVHVYREGSHNQVHMLHNDNLIEIGDEYYYNSAAARWHGYRWSGREDDWIHEDNAVYVENEEDWWSANDIDELTVVNDEYYTVDYVLTYGFWDGDTVTLKETDTPIDKLKSIIREKPADFCDSLWAAIDEPDVDEETALVSLPDELTIAA